MEIPLKEIEMLADYCEMDLINGVQMNLEEWTDVVDKVRAWVEAAEQSMHLTGGTVAPAKLNPISKLVALVKSVFATRR